MKVKYLVCMSGTFEVRNVGDVGDVGDVEAKNLIAAGFAEEVAEEVEEGSSEEAEKPAPKKKK